MIKLIPSKIEAYDTDENGKVCEHMFTVEAQDEGCCTLIVSTVLSNDTVEEVLSAIRDAMKMLELE